jgi:FkbM family methyltransferase
MLKRNTSQYNNIVTIHGALWNENDDLDLIDPGFGEWGFMTQGFNSKAENLFKSCQRVRGLTLDRIMEEHGIEFIDLLKIDIEGAEREVFFDPSHWIGKVGAMIVELHERLKPGCNRSFYNATNDFDEEWHQGEYEYLTKKEGCLKMPAAV